MAYGTEKTKHGWNLHRAFMWQSDDVKFGQSSKSTLEHDLPFTSLMQVGEATLTRLGVAALQIVAL